MHQLALLWEAAFDLSEFFWRLFQCVHPFPDAWFTSTPAHTALSVQQFLTKNGTTPVSHPPCSPNLTLSDFYLFVFPGEKSPQRETFCWCGRGETKKGRSSKRHKNWWVQKLLSTWKIVSIGVLHQMGSTLKVTEVQTGKNKYTIFLNKFWRFLGG